MNLNFIFNFVRRQKIVESSCSVRRVRLSLPPGNGESPIYALTWLLSRKRFKLILSGPKLKMGRGCNSWTETARFTSLILLLGTFFVSPAHAQESPYIVAYHHYLEEPGNLEVEYFSTLGTQRGGNNFHAYWAEFEYGVTAWYTTELYLDGQTTFGDSTVFTGFRWENRFRLLEHEHWINPVLYIEYEQIDEADKIIKEVEGNDIESDHGVPNAVARRTVDHELEFKLLLSGTFKGWNVAVNPLATKNLSPSDPWEFGYAIGTSRQLALSASPMKCNFCRENFIAGIEMCGGLGDTESFGLHQTSHYVAPVLAWNIPSGWTVRLSPGFGLNNDSHRLLMRWGLSREFSGFGDTLRRFFRGRQ